MKTVKARVGPKPIQYDAFLQLDGRHPWSGEVPEGLIAYPARRVAGGKVSYFNFDLAREMGLIAANHPDALTPELTERLLDTFCLRIVNEYDTKHGVRFPKNRLKPHPYMATRYLQMQHPDKSGRTSGDGRAIWNGTIKHQGRTWDVSSRGTGVTALSPGAVRAGEPLQSGSTEFGYGCGLAEIDELYGQAIAAEIFHRNGIPTERVLALIDLGRGVGIGVRAAPNLLRPAHLFLYLKQNRREPLVRAIDYLIKRQFENGAWSIRPDAPDRFAKVLGEITRAYARFVARLERDYIFAWLEWDGDNVLADAGIIDYGSVRQFGLRHDQYRYDDVERFSTNLNEQRRKARDIVQTFAQAFDFATTGHRRAFPKFNADPALVAFDREFETARLEFFLGQCGYTKVLARVLMNKHRPVVERLFAAHEELERVKTHRPLVKVADGIHRPAILNMRAALLRLPAALAERETLGAVAPREFFGWIIASHANRRDRRPGPALLGKLARYQELYTDLLDCVAGAATRRKTLEGLRTRAAAWNNPNRMTGNALINIVDDILRHRRGGLNSAEIQSAIEGLIASQTFDPDYRPARAPAPKNERHLTLLNSILTTIDGFREDI